MRIYLYLALHSDTLCAVIYPFSGLLYRTLEFCTSECRLDNTRRHLHVSRGYTHLVCLALRVRYVCYTLAEGYYIGTKKVEGGKQLDISICPVNISMQRHCCRQEVVISGKKSGGLCPPSKKVGGQPPPCPPFPTPLAGF